jgi:hypothetical protein
VLCLSFLDFFIFLILSLSMTSSSNVACVLEMVQLRANGFGILILFPIEANGFTSVSSFHLSIKFSLQDSIIWVECEIYDSVTSLLIMRENFVWEL